MLRTISGIILIPMSLLAAAPPADPPPRTDLYGDPLPPGAIARLGTTRLRTDSPVSAAVFSPDGKTLATTCWNKTVQFWDVATGRELRRMPNAADHALAWSPDGKLLAGGGKEKVIRLWEAESGNEIAQLFGHEQMVTVVAFSPDGRRLASLSGNEKAARIWDVSTRKTIRQLPNSNDKPVFCLAWSPDRKTVAIGDWDNQESGTKSSVRLWDAETGRELRVLKGHNGGVMQVAWSQDGKQLASADGEGTVCLWNASTGEQLRRFGAASGDELWKQLRAVSASLHMPLATEKPEGYLLSVQGLLFTPDNKTLIVGSGSNGYLLCFNVASGQETARWLSGQIFALALSPDGRTIAGGGGLQMVQLWDAATGRPKLQFAGSQGRVYRAVFSPDGALLASMGDDRLIRLYDTKSWREIRQLVGHRDATAVVAFSPDGKALASGGHDGSVRVWEIATGKQLQCFEESRLGWVHLVAISQDGRAVEGAGGGLQILWDLATGKELRRNDSNNPAPQTWTPPHPGGAYRRAVTPDERTAITGGEDGTIRLWEVSTRQERCRLDGHRSPIRGLAVSPDGQWLASSSGDHWDRTDIGIRIWDLRSGQEMPDYARPGIETGWLDFAPNGKAVVSANADTTILVWDLAGLARAQSLQDLRDEYLEAQWATLGKPDAAQAYQSIVKLGSSKQTVEFMRKRLPPITRPDPKQVARWLADLDSDQFKVRQQAAEGLGKLGELAAPALRQALADQTSLEARRRLEALLEAQASPIVTDPELLRALRAIEVLEQIADAAARQVLENLAKGAPEARVTEAATGALRRLKNRNLATR